MATLKYKKLNEDGSYSWEQVSSNMKNLEDGEHEGSIQGSLLKNEASKKGAIAFGNNSIASGEYSFAIGNQVNASGEASHAEGHKTIASGMYSHAEGYSGSGQSTIASGVAAHAEGEGTLAIGRNSHSEGEMTEARGRGSHAEGKKSIAYGMYTHAEGSETKAGFVDETEGQIWGDQAVHTEGFLTIAVDRYTHAEGYNTYAGFQSDDDNYPSDILKEDIKLRPEIDPDNGNHNLNYDASSAAHAEGYTTKSYGFASHSEGRETIANGNHSHAEGQSTIAQGHNSHAEGVESFTSINAPGSHAEGAKTKTFGDNSHAEGGEAEAHGEQSHAEGGSTKTYGHNSHAEGWGTMTGIEGDSINYGNSAHAEGWETIAYAHGAHSEGRGTKAYTLYSHAEGHDTEAGVDGYANDQWHRAAHAEGLRTKAKTVGSHSEGMDTVASGNASHAEGNNTFAEGKNSHAGGQYSKAFGNNSYTSGEGTIAAGKNSVVEGKYNKIDVSNSATSRSYKGDFVLNSSYKMSNVVLYNNNLYLAVKSSFTAAKTPDLDTTNWRNWSSKDNDVLGIYAHIIGNGDSESSRDNAYTLKWTGEAWYKGAVTTTGADYAEYFEWVDGNPNTEDRVGHFVTLEGDKIIIANESSDIIGVVSAAPAIIGDSYESSWQGKYLTDIFGRIIYEDVEVEYEDSSINDEGDEVVSKHTKIESRPKLNPNYDNSHEYIPRSKRPEWATIGFLGKFVVIDDGTCVAGQRCSCNNSGIATKGNKYRVLKRLDENHVQILANFL